MVETKESAELLTDRYGGAKRSYPRWTRYLIVAGVLLVGLVVALVAEHNLGDGPISTDVVSYDTRGDASIELTFNLTRDTNAAVDCIVSARDAGGTEVGRREVYIAGGNDARTVTTSIATTSRAQTAQMYGCSYQVPRYLLPAAQVG